MTLDTLVSGLFGLVGEMVGALLSWLLYITRYRLEVENLRLENRKAKTEVENLETSARTIKVLINRLDKAQRALERGKNKTARNKMENFIGKVVSKSNLKETKADKIGAYEANSLICGAANVLIGIPIP